MAIVVLIGVILLKVTGLACLVGAAREWTILLVPLAGRCAAVIQMSGFPYARSSGGLASVFCQKRSIGSAVWAVILLAAVAWYSAGANGLWAAGCSVAVALIFSLWCQRKIGGFTGDTLGAACEITEVIPILTAAVLFR
jgi:adenosylcobinamide-GDP ribazoletransferase